MNKILSGHFLWANISFKVHLWFFLLHQADEWDSSLGSPEPENRNSLFQIVKFSEENVVLEITFGFFSESFLVEGGHNFLGFFFVR